MKNDIILENLVKKIWTNMHVSNENNSSYWKSINSPFCEYLILSKTIGAFHQIQVSFLVKNLGKSY